MGGPGSNRSGELNCLVTYGGGGMYSEKLDGGGPVDNRPSTDKLHHFVRKEEEEKKTRHRYSVPISGV